MNKAMLAFAAEVLPTPVKNVIKRYPPLCDLRRLLIRRQDYWQKVLRGKHLSIELTNSCNLACKYCPRDAMLKRKTREIGYMDSNLFKRIVDQAAALKLEVISEVGYGEPLMHPDFVESIRYLRQKMPSVEILLSTNAILLSERVAGAIVECEVDQIVLSLNLASREKYEAINGADRYDLVVQNVKNFLSILNRDGIKRRTHAYVQILKELHTQSELDEFRKLWSPLMAPNAELSVKPLTDWAGLVDLSSLGVAGLSASSNENPFEPDRYPCTAIYGRVITFDGRVLACCLALPIMPKELIVGDARVQALEDIMDNDKVRHLKRLNLNEGLETIFPCRNCNRWRDRPNIFVKNRIPMMKRKWY